MKSVLMSIQPKWCELIASGKKTVEVRKTRPKIDTPFKAYIYCTRGKDILAISKYPDKSVFLWDKSDVDRYNADMVRNGKVIGEFVCHKITEFYPTMDLKQLTSIHFQMCEKSCVNMRDLYNYANGKILYSWHISDLVIYDKPKELSEFITICPEWEKEYLDTKCLRCKYYFSNCADMRHKCTVEGEKPLTKPPQSWCYVEAQQNHNPKE